MKKPIYLDASLRHDGTAGDVVLALVDHHEAAEDEVAFQLGGFLHGPSEIERLFRAGRLDLADGQSHHH